MRLMWEKDKQQRSNKRSEMDWDGPVFSFGSLHLRSNYVSLTVFLRHGRIRSCFKKLQHGIET